MSFNAKKSMKGKKAFFSPQVYVIVQPRLQRTPIDIPLLGLVQYRGLFFRLLKPEIIRQIQNPARVVILDKQFSIAVSRAKIKLTFCMEALYAVLWMLNNCLLLIKIRTQKLFPDN